jgi:hypothetical protein
MSWLRQDGQQVDNAPRRLRAPRMKRGEPQPYHLIHMSPNFDLLQIAID